MNPGLESELLIAMTQVLVRTDSQTPPSATGEAVQVVKEFLADIPGLQMQHYVGEAPVENLVAVLEGGLPGPRTILSGHLDTYPIGDAEAWGYDPLGGCISDGYLYGRGSADMKGGVAVLIAVLARWAKRRPFPGSIVLALAGDEERMGELGTQWLIDNAEEIHGDGVLVADVGGPSTIRLGEKGMLWLDITAKGKQAHSAHTYAGTNAADRLVDALIALRAIQALVPRPPEDALQIMEAATALSEENTELRRTMAALTVNIGLIQAGTSPNLIPASAEAAIDIRIPIGLTTAQVEAALAAHLDNREGISWAITRRYEPSWTYSRSAFAQACLRGAGNAAIGNVWMDNRIGGSDARLWRRAGYPCAVVGLTPLNLGAPDEACRISELNDLLLVYDHMLKSLHEAQLS